MSNWFVVVAAGVGAGMGPLLGIYARGRSARQPLPVCTRDEERVLAHVLARPEDLALVSALRPEDFAVDTHRDLWAALARPRDGANDGDGGQAEELGEASAPDELITRLRAIGAQESARRVLRCAKRVLRAGEDRALTGRAPIERTGRSEDPMARVVPVPPGQGWILGGICGLGSACAWAVASGEVGAVGAVGVVVLWWTCVAVALVDLDTLYVDYPTLIGGTALAWLATFAGVDVNVRAERALFAIIVACSVGLALDLFARLYGRIRHRTGLGGGDVVIFVATSLIVLCATGEARWVIWGFITAAFGAALVEFAAGMRDRDRLSRPFPFGPYLAAGWLVAWTIGAAIGIAP